MVELEMSGRLSAHRLGGFLPAGTPARVLQETGSTNHDAKQWLAEGAPHGALVLAARQNAGRGRLGRSFASPPGGLYMSVCLRCAPGSSLSLLTAAAAVAVCEAVSALCGLELCIKWVNDLFYNGKKCCGILAEAAVSPGGAIDAVVAGIGINYTTPPGALPPEAGNAGALFPQGTPASPGAPVSPEQLAAGIHTRLLGYFSTLEARAFLPEYRRRNIVPGRRVTVLTSPPWQGTAVGIDDEARLVVRAENGVQQALAAGEIRVTME